MAWCISHDTQPRFALTALPTAAIIAYFRRIGIAWPPRALKPDSVSGA
jgi:hypothetical protein